jgi:hypothetical protein
MDPAAALQLGLTPQGQPLQTMPGLSHSFFAISFIKRVFQALQPILVIYFTMSTHKSK